MRGQSRSRQTTTDQESLDLLQQLIETPPAPQHGWRAPVALRSASEQRRLAFSGYLLRTWFDSVLQHTERLLVIAALLVFGYWVYDGPMRDWLYLRAQAAQAAPIESRAATVPTTLPTATAGGDEVGELAPLPFTTPAMGGEGDAFIAPRPAGAAIVEAAPEPTRLQIPAIALDTGVREVFVRDGAWEVADYAAGYMHGTALPGEAGTMALAGHAGMRGGVFRDLGRLQAGDDVVVDAAGWRYRYRVRELFNVLPTQTEVLAPTDAPTLVLITCTNWDTERLIVAADLIESRPIPER
jgi:sortase A